MQAVFLGFSEREAFALSLLAGKVLPDWQCQAAPMTVEPTAGDLYVLDASAWQPHAGRESLPLQALVGDCPVIWITPMHASAMAAGGLAGNASAPIPGHWVVLDRPYGAAAMRSALEEARAKGGAPRAAPKVGRPEPAPEVAFSISAFGIKAVDSARPAKVEVLPTLGQGSLSVEAFRLCGPTSPHEACRVFLQQLAERLTQAEAFEMVVTLINGLIFHPGQGWVASNTPLSVIRMVCRSRSLTEHVRMTPLAPTADARSRAEQRGMTIHPLGDMLFALAQLAECQLPA